MNKIVHVVPRHSSAGVRGSQMRISAVSDALSEVGSVTRVSPGKIGDQLAKRFSLLGDQKPIAALGYLASRPFIRSSLKKASFGVIEFPWAFPFCRGLNIPLVYSSHNVERDKFLSYAKALHREAPSQVRYVEALERLAVRSADRIIVVSDADRIRLIDLFGVEEDRVWVIPNCSQFAERPSPNAEERATARKTFGLSEGSTAVFLAGTDAPPNQRGARVIVEVARLLPHIQFLITGAVDIQGTLSNVRWVGVLPSVRPALAVADFALCPIDTGAGTKVKLLDYIGFGLPTIAFEPSVWGLPKNLVDQLIVVPPTVEALVHAVNNIGEARAAQPNLAPECPSWQTATHQLKLLLHERYGNIEN